MNLTRRSLFASAVALLALPRRVAAERLLGPVATTVSVNHLPIVTTPYRATIRGQEEFGANIWNQTHSGTLRLDWSGDGGKTWQPVTPFEYRP